MPIKNVTIHAKECECLRCGHVWVPRPRWNKLLVLLGKKGAWETPVAVGCPKCKSPYWDKERRP